MTGLNSIVDVIIPGDPLRSLPRASLTNFDEYLDRYSMLNLGSDFIAMLDKICEEKFGGRFADLNSNKRLQAVNACRSVNVRLFADFVTHLFRCYYTSPHVLLKIGAGSVPPFPLGNIIPEDDWTILESVYERGKFYRDI